MTISVIAVDPGLATGVALLRWDGTKGVNPILEHSAEVAPKQFGPLITQYMEWTSNEPGLHVACERFTINMQTAKNTQAPWSLEEIGVLKDRLEMAGFDSDSITMQAPADAKNAFPNPKLHKIGTWHKGGAGHANDAIRHGLLQLMKLGWWSPDMMTST